MEEELKNMKSQVVSRVDPCMNELYRMWMDIGYTQDEQQRHLRLSVEKIETFLNDLILNQRAVRRQLEAEVEQETVVIHKMCTDLQIPVFYPPRDTPLLNLQHILVERRGELERQFRERLERHAEVMAKLAQLCTKLGDVSRETCEYVQLTSARACPSANDLQIGERNCAELETLLRTRLERFTDVRSDVVRLVEELEYEIENESEARIVNAKLDSPTDSNANANASVLRHKTSTNGQSQSALKNIASNCNSPRFRGTPNSSTDRLDAVPNSSKLTDTGSDGDGEQTSSSNELPLSEATLRDADAFRTKLVKRKAFLVGSIEEARVRLTSLWHRLGVDAAYTERFLEESNNTCGSSFKESTLKRLRDEEQRLVALKMANASAYINSLLQEIRALHDACYVNADENETTQIDESYAEKNNEELTSFIENLERQVEDLSAYRDRHKHVFDSISRFEVARRELADLEARLKTPEVLCNRGGILLKLQKEQKALLKELPKLESEIQAVISEAEKSEGVRIDVFGVPFREYAEALRNEAATQKVRSSSRRRAATAQPTVSGDSDASLLATPGARRTSTARNNSPSRTLRK